MKNNIKTMFWTALFIFILLPPSFAADCYINDGGSGLEDGTSALNAYDWANGAGLVSCKSDVSAGDTIHLAYGNYTLTAAITWDKSGTSGNPITIQGSGSPATGGNWGKSVLDAKYAWPTITGNRELPYAESDADSGGNFINFSTGVDYVTFKHFNIKRFEYPFYAAAYKNDHITITDMYMEDIRIAFYVVADLSCDDGSTAYSCDGDDGSNNWDVERIYALGVSKKLFRSEGVRDSTITDTYADCKDVRGFINFNDFAILYHFDGASKDITLTRTVGKNPGYHEGVIYDNGDCYATESYTSNISFTNSYCYDSFDAGFDLKGGPHTVTNAVAFKVGNRAFRVWHGPVTIANSIAGFSGQGDFSQYANGSNSALWIGGIVNVSNFTSINNTRPYLFEGPKLDVMTYDGGSGSVPVAGELVTGTSSGSIAKIAKVDGDETSGTLTIYNRTALFTNNEQITTTGGFDALADGDGSTDSCGELNISDSTLALDHNHATSTLDSFDDCTAGNPTPNETDVAKWIYGVSGTDPQFPDSTDITFEGDNNNFNSALYTDTKGYYNLVTEENLNQVTFSGVSN